MLVAKGVDKKNVDTKIRVHGHVIESLTLCRSNKGRRREVNAIQTTAVQSKSDAHGNNDVTLALFPCYSSPQHNHQSTIVCGYLDRFMQQGHVHSLNICMYKCTFTGEQD